MEFCEHCQGQRFDRAQVLRILRETGRRLRRERRFVDAEEVMAQVIHVVRNLDLPHLEVVDDSDMTGHVVH